MTLVITLHDMTALAIDTHNTVRAVQEAGFEEAPAEAAVSKIGAATSGQYSGEPACNRSAVGRLGGCVTENKCG